MGQRQIQEDSPTHKPLYNTICYNTVLDITQFKDGSQKTELYVLPPTALPLDQCLSENEHFQLQEL